MNMKTGQQNMEGANAASMSRHSLMAASVAFVLIVIAGILPNAAHAVSSIVPDKVLHFIAYGMLSLLFYYGLPARASLAARVLATWLLIAMLGALDEAIQSLMPYRNADMLDWLCNMTASLTCITVLASINVARNRNAN